MNDLFQTLFAVAWADGELRDEEREFLAELVHRSEAGQDASGWFTEAPPEPEWSTLRADQESASAILRQAMYMAATDHTVQFEETMLMDRLRDQLGLSEAQFHRIQKEVEQAHEQGHEQG